MSNQAFKYFDTWELHKYQELFCKKLQCMADIHFAKNRIVFRTDKKIWRVIMQMVAIFHIVTISKGYIEVQYKRIKHCQDCRYSGLGRRCVRDPQPRPFQENGCDYYEVKPQDDEP